MVARIATEFFWGETKLKRIIDRQTLSLQEERNSERIGKVRSLYASDYGQCMKKSFFSFFPEKYVVGELDARVVRIFQNGDAVHERLANYLRREAELQFRDEVDVPRDGLDVHGRCDGICLLDGRVVVVEFKSINREAVQEAKEEHIGQVSWYMAMWSRLRDDLKEDFGFSHEESVCEKDVVGVESASGRTYELLEDVEKMLLFSSGDIVGEIIYESKVNNETFHFPVDWDADRMRKVRLWFEQLKWHVEHEEVPKVPYERSRFPCQWKGGKCQYFETCWGAG
jgi:hypothetical protein